MVRGSTSTVRAGDLNGSGGRQRAVLVSRSTIAYCRTLRRDDFEYGQFGENLTVDGLTDDEVSLVTATASRGRVRGYPAAGDLLRVGMRLSNRTAGTARPPPSPARLLLSRPPPKSPKVESRPAELSSLTRVGPHRSASPTSDALLYLPIATRPAANGPSRYSSAIPGWAPPTPPAAFRYLLNAALSLHHGGRRRSATNRTGPDSGNC